MSNAEETDLTLDSTLGSILLLHEVAATGCQGYTTERRQTGNDPVGFVLFRPERVVELDQQSKIFSTQIPVNAIESVEIVTGAAAAEYGNKTSLVIQ
ncbi:MAG TPA: hypothetical protein VN956_05145 [Pyrinomonadaceae bacterium]|nr:hypothetical protein [Pyrinomonadaceae bacterium]